MNITTMFNKKPLIFTFVLAVFLLIFFVLYSPPCKVQIPNYPEDEKVDRSLITSEPCAPPCWYGLLPSTSTQDDVTSVLQTLPFVDDSSINVGTHYPNFDTIGWNSSLTNWASNDVFLDNRGIVQRIDIELEYMLTLEHLIDQVGEPDYFRIEIINPRTCWEYQVHMEWLELGLGVSTPYFEGTPNEQLITEDMFIQYVSYMPSADNLTDYLVGFYVGDREAAEAGTSGYREWTGFEEVILHTR